MSIIGWLMIYLGFEKHLLLGRIGIASVYNANNVRKLLLNVANSCPQDAFTTTSRIAVETEVNITMLYSLCWWAYQYGWKKPRKIGSLSRDGLPRDPSIRCRFSSTLLSVRNRIKRYMSHVATNVAVIQKVMAILSEQSVRYDWLCGASLGVRCSFGQLKREQITLLGLESLFVDLRWPCFT